jgi:hypothetical protein
MAAAGNSGPVPDLYQVLRERAGGDGKPGRGPGPQRRPR